MGLKEKRRAREAKRRAAQRERVHMADISAAESRGYQSGHESGAKFGTNVAVREVLDHAGDLYKAGKDVEAAAVRALHAKLQARHGTVNAFKVA